MYPTLREVLELPVVARGAPVVRSAAAAVDVPVRSVHVSELGDVAGTLTRDVLVLSVGLALTDPELDACAYVRSLLDAGASGLAVELGRHVTSLPEALVQAARAAGFPVVELRRAVRFLEVVETVHAMVVDPRHERLRMAERAHQAFGGIAVTAAGPERIVAGAAELIGLPVVLEDVRHRALVYAGGPSAEVVLRDWTARSRRVPVRAFTSSDGPERWTCTPVGPPGQRWGRLVVPTSADEHAGMSIVLERAAEALTVGRLLEGDALSMALEAQSKLLRDLLDGAATDEGSLRARAMALGLGAAPEYIPLALRIRSKEHLQLVVSAVRSAGALGGVLDGRIGLLLPSTEDAVQRVMDSVPAGLIAAAGAGPPVRRLLDLPAAFEEALQIVDVAPDDGRVRRSADLGIRGLLRGLRDHPHVQQFVEDQLAPLLALPAARRTDHLTVLRTFLGAGSMTAFAEAMQLSRAAAYGRLRTVERALGARLSDPETRLGIHLAVLALDHREAGDPGRRNNPAGADGGSGSPRLLVADSPYISSERL
ncbi:PucR family transcriptional regulator [Kribbella swartbergensis]